MNQHRSGRQYKDNIMMYVSLMNDITEGVKYSFDLNIVGDVNNIKLLPVRSIKKVHNHGFFFFFWEGAHECRRKTWFLILHVTGQVCST